MNWQLEVKVDVSASLAVINRLETVPQILEEIAEIAAEEVRDNIRQKNIIDTGALLDSIESELVNDEMSQVNDGVTYGIYNELGTYKMAARPFFLPAMHKAGNIFSQKIAALLSGK